MLKLTRAIIALTLGLMIGLSMFTSGVFAQSVGPNTPKGSAYATYHGYGQNGYDQSHGQYGYNQFHGRSGYNQFHGRGWNGHTNRYRSRYAKCGRIAKYGWVRHFTRRAAYQSCSKW